MTYALVLPPELLQDLVLIRKMTKESIRSLCLTAIHERSTEVIKGMVVLHSKDYINSLAEELNKPYIAQENSMRNN